MKPRAVLFCLALCLGVLSGCPGDSGSTDSAVQDRGLEGLTFIDSRPFPDKGPPLPDMRPLDGQPPPPDGQPPPPDGQPPPPDQTPPPPDQGPACYVDGDCDDGLSCTTNKCVNGSCKNSVNPNFCAIAGQCVAIDTVNPSNVCQKCQPTLEPWDWSNYVCTTLLAGTGQTGTTDGATSIARFYYPAGVAVGPSGEIYVADDYNHRIRMISGGQVTTLAGSTGGFGDGAAGLAKFNRPFGVAVGSAGEVYVADYNNHRIRKIAGGQVSTLAGTGAAGFADGLASAAKFYHPMGVAVGPSGEVYVADQYTHRIRMIASGQVSTLAGSGTAGFLNGAAASARFYHPAGVAVSSGGDVYVADRHNHRIRLVKNGQVTTLAGSGTAGFLDGGASTARFYYPAGVTVGASGEVFVADEYNHRIRKIAGGQVTTLGGGAAGYANSPSLVVQFYYPWGIARSGSTLFIGDRHNHRIRKISW